MTGERHLFRKAIGTVVGLLVCNLAIYGWQYLLAWLPFGAAVLAQSDPGDPAYLTTMPLAAQGWLAASWFVGPLVGGFVAFALGWSNATGWIVAALSAALGLANLVGFAHPLWLGLAAVAFPFVGAVIAFGIYRRWRAARLHLRH